MYFWGKFFLKYKSNQASRSNHGEGNTGDTFTTTTTKMESENSRTQEIPLDKPGEIKCKSKGEKGEPRKKNLKRHINQIQGMGLVQANQLQKILKNQ